MFFILLKTYQSATNIREQKLILQSIVHTKEARFYTVKDFSFEILNTYLSSKSCVRPGDRKTTAMGWQEKNISNIIARDYLEAIITWRLSSSQLGRMGFGAEAFSKRKTRLDGQMEKALLVKARSSSANVENPRRGASSNNVQYESSCRGFCMHSTQ